ncbi:MAG: cation:proton antiporter [Pseudomonadota bacterium]
MSSTLLMIVGGFAGVLLAVAATPLIAARTALPMASLHAGLGIVLGLAALTYHNSATELPPLTGLIDALVALGGEGIIALFLPPLLFEASLRVDTRRLIADIVPVLVLAIVAVVLTTLLVATGLVVTIELPWLWAVALGAVVATTDPSAVLAVFKQVGAPQRLQALVEGESLLNDAAAIVLFAAVLEVLQGEGDPGVQGIATSFAATFAGGGLLGAAAGYLASLAVARSRDTPEVATTISLALPYLTFVVAELYFDISGVVAVVLSGLVLGRALQTQVPPVVARQVLDLWGQLAGWAGALIVVGAMLLAPLTMVAEPIDLRGLVVVVVGCLVARAIIIYIVLPALAEFRVAAPVSHPFRLAMLWGGLRGAVTIALAVTLAANATLDETLRAQVALMAAALALFTLFVQAPTLPLLLRALGLQGLSRLDRVLKDRASRAVRARLGDRVADLRSRLRLEAASDADFVDGGEIEASAEAPAQADRRERMVAAVAGITEREAEHYRQLYDDGIVSRDAAAILAQGPAVLAEALVTNGLAALAAAAKREVDYTWPLRLGLWVYRRLGWGLLLARGLALRYEVVLMRRAVLMRLRRDVADELGVITDEAAASRVDTLLGARLDAHQRALEALRVQYPEFASRLETRFLQRAALRLERQLYDELLEDGLLNGAAHRELVRQVRERRQATARLPSIDLRVDVDAMLHRVPMVDRLDKRSRRALRRALRPGLAIPGERLIRRGDRGDAMYFIVDGAAAVIWPQGRRTLGPGDVVGEIALVTGQRRTADVVALGYVSYLALGRADYRRLTAGLQDLRAEVARLALDRERERRGEPSVSRETAD